MEKMLNKENPKVSVMIITYNHEKYIGQAIESVLNQKTEYDFEINIIEDCSTDNTQKVILPYKEKYPDKINLYFNDVNVGTLDPPPQKVFHKGFKTMKGDYIAILEGDDYWSSPDKLQKQISFLENNKSYSGCAHNVVKIYEDNSKEPHRFIYHDNIKPDHTIDDFITMTSFFHLSTLMFRNVLKGEPHPQFKNKYSCDIFNTMVHATYGPIRYFNEDMSVYRAHAGGNFSNLSNINGRVYNIEGLRRYNRWLSYKYFLGFISTLHRLVEDLLVEEKKENQHRLTILQRWKYRYLKGFYKLLLDTVDFCDNYTKKSYWIELFQSLKSNLFSSGRNIMLKSKALTYLYRSFRNHIYKRPNR